MNTEIPSYLLFADADHLSQTGQWRFTVRMPDGSKYFEAADMEPDARGERLDLLTVVRALESLDQPSKVTLVGCSPYIRQGLHYGLPEWRDNGWQWEFYGQMVPIKNRDLWQRLDRTLRFHQVELRWWRIDQPHVATCSVSPPEQPDPEPMVKPTSVLARGWEGLRQRVRRVSGRYQGWAAAWRRLSRPGGDIAPGPASC